MRQRTVAGQACKCGGLMRKGLQHMRAWNTPMVCRGAMQSVRAFLTKLITARFRGAGSCLSWCSMVLFSSDPQSPAASPPEFVTDQV